MLQIDPRIVLTPLPGEGDLGLVDALAQLSFAIQGALGQIAASQGLSVVQARLLGILRDRQPSIKELAVFLRLDKSSVTGLIDRAEERGLVRRTSSEIDGRSVLVSITAAGRKVVARATTAFESEITDLVADLTPAQRTHLSATATVVVTEDAARRGIDLSTLGDAKTAANQML